MTARSAIRDAWNAGLVAAAALALELKHRGKDVVAKRLFLDRVAHRGYAGEQVFNLFGLQSYPEVSI